MTTDSLINYTGSILLGDNIEIPWHNFFQSLEVEIIPGGAWRGSIVLYDDAVDALEQAIVSLASNRNINFSFGWDDPHQGARREYFGYVLQFQPEYLPRATILTLDVIARPMGTALLGLATDGRPAAKVLSFPEGKRASEIVERIVQEYGWSTTDHVGRRTIEPTEPPLETPFNTSGESPLKFIKEQLLQQARNSQGASGYVALFDERGTFHFRTPHFLSAASHLYRYPGGGGAGEVIRFAPQDTAIFGVLNGGGNARYTSAASMQGGTTLEQTTSAGGAGNAGTPAVQDSAAKPNLGQGTHSIIKLNVRNPEEVQRIAQAGFENFRHPYQAVLEVHGTHRVRSLDYITFEFTKPNGELHYLSGNFLVTGFKHALGNGTPWTTEFQMVRTGSPLVQGTEPLVVSKTITPQEAESADDRVGIVVES